MRRYRMTSEGEKPVWASKRKLIELGEKEGRDAFLAGREPIRMSNTTYDDAARKAFERLKHR